MTDRLPDPSSDLHGLSPERQQIWQQLHLIVVMLTTGHTAPLPIDGQGPAQTVDKLDTGGLFVQLCIKQSNVCPSHSSQKRLSSSRSGS